MHFFCLDPFFIPFNFVFINGRRIQLQRLVCSFSHVLSSFSTKNIDPPNHVRGDQGWGVPGDGTTYIFLLIRHKRINGIYVGIYVCVEGWGSDVSLLEAVLGVRRISPELVL